MRCKTCHYSLENLTEHRCPECGTPFDPNDPSTFESPPQRPRLWSAVFVFLGFMAGCWLLIVLAPSARSNIAKGFDTRAEGLVYALKLTGLISGVLTAVVWGRWFLRSLAAPRNDQPR